MSTLHNPPHPGEVLQGLYLEPLDLSVTKAAKGMGISRSALSEYINGHTSTSLEMAVRLSKAFGTTPGVWLRHQAAYDAWQAETAIDINVDDIKVFYSKNEDDDRLLSS